MLAPGRDAGCPGCSVLSDHVDGALAHLDHHDIGYVAVSRAPLEAYRRRMGWRFPLGLVARVGFRLRLSGLVHAGAARERTD